GSGLMVQQVRCKMNRRRRERRLVIRFEKRFNFRPDGRARRCEQRRALAHREIGHRVKQAFDFLPV
ncbi:MAG TPA: hypothetical protein VJS11_13705, partial [Acidobacteriaceae bacterium]|nr:hypothetical protein [Acidobacteriaceae bacterium]